MSAFQSSSFFEPLEDRRHLNATMVTDKLLVKTGSGNDTVFIYTRANGAIITVLENGVMSDFLSSGVKSIEDEIIWIEPMSGTVIDSRVA